MSEWFYFVLLLFACIGAFDLSKKITGWLMSKILKRDITLTVVDKNGVTVQKTVTLDPKNKDDADLMAHLDKIKEDSSSVKYSDDARRLMSKELAEWIASNKVELFAGEKPTENLIDAIDVAVKNYERLK